MNASIRHRVPEVVSIVAKEYAEFEPKHRFCLGGLSAGRSGNATGCQVIQDQPTILVVALGLVLNVGSAGLLSLGKLGRRPLQRIARIRCEASCSVDGPYLPKIPKADMSVRKNTILFTRQFSRLCCSDVCLNSTTDRSSGQGAVCAGAFSLNWSAHHITVFERPLDNGLNAGCPNT